MVIDVTESSPSRKIKLLSRLSDAVVLESNGSHEELTTSEQFKVGLCDRILDAFLMELNRRLNEKNVEHMRVIHACCPQCTHFLEPETLLPLVHNYKLDSESLNLDRINSSKAVIG